MKQLIITQALFALFSYATQLESLLTIDSGQMTDCTLAATDTLIGVQCEERIVIYYHQEGQHPTVLYDEPILTKTLAKTYTDGLSFVRVDNEALNEYTLIMFTQGLD